MRLTTAQPGDLARSTDLDSRDRLHKNPSDLRISVLRTENFLVCLKNIIDLIFNFARPFDD